MGNRCMTICCPPDTEGADAVEEALQSHSEALRSGLSTASTLHGEILRDPLASHKTMATILPGDEKQPGPPPVRTPSKEVEARLAAMERATRPPGALDSQQTILDGYDAAGIAMPLRGNRLGSFASTLPAGPSRLASFRTEEARISAGPTRHTLRAHGEQRRTKTVHRGGGGCLDLGWSPLAAGLLATSTESGSVLLWDLSCIGARQASEEAAEAAPELAFLHGGHVRTGKRHCAGLPVAWSREVDFLLASSAFTADDSKGAQAKSSVANVPGHGGADVHVWRPSRLLVPESY
eukprot:TRINITY_DN26086_c0_g1_i1.p1 TRINITY_DN26086_c0_g1~~TRINITY_DN26086_c0_g1_i1.p1  ORF type:complete len:293 (-),score=60.55 TRINITY_DN26086_c0_g1_i1:238-1116(-)